MKRLLLSLTVLMLMCGGISAQRTTDKLDRGLVAMKVGNSVFVNWRILADEYYDVTYNVYRDGQPVAQNLGVSNFTDPQGTLTSTYSVAAVVNGQEKEQCTAMKPWNSSYKEIKLKHEGIKSTLIPNDACCADVDGDGELEILMKFDNQEEIANGFPKEGNNGEYTIFECLKQDGTRLWWVNCGPNMGDFQNNEQNIVGYDWDGDGCAEVVMRLEEGSVIHMADGTTYTLGADGKNGTSWTNYRSPKVGGVEWFTCYGKEFLVYCNGMTGVPYQVMTYPLARLESDESDLNKAWGDGYGHRCSKFFFGAPYLDGRKPSLFLARGIYTRHKMVAYDIDPTTHKLQQRWKWYNNTNGPWKGQGYHNYAIADVDMDGRDEIVFGSMVIDDNGKGLSTTGYGHGDAEQVGDLNPYRHGLEVFACMEDNPGTNFRDATTSKVLFRYTAGRDVGRCMAGNFSNTYPGGIGTPTGGRPISTVTAAINNNLVEDGINQNFRIYWDGDLCEETFNYVNGKNTEGCIAKYGSWSPIYTCAGSMTNNDTKGTPCYQGDIMGDWREEIIMRTSANNIRIYSTPTPTKWRIPSLWYDHQYRNAMVWQMCGYNQPPRPSYFIGEIEGITIAPPPLTMTGRTEVTSGGTVNSSMNGQHVIVCETKNSDITIEAGAQPRVLTFNVPTWVQGTAASEATTQNTKINYVTYTCTVSGSGLSGNATLVKQGDGILTLPKTDFTHTGATNIWGGTLNFDGSMKKSPLWLNRHTTLNSDGGQFMSIRADYGSTIRPGGANHQGTINADTLSLGFGSRLSIDLYTDNLQADIIKTKVLKIEAKTTEIWKNYGPEYLMPVVELNPHLATGTTLLPAGKYVIAEVGEIDGAPANFIIEGLNTQKRNIIFEDGKLIVEIIGMRDPAAITWSGSQNANWDVFETANFIVGSDAEVTTFVSGDEVNFTDDATVKSINIAADVYPAKVIVNSTQAYTIDGKAIAGNAELNKLNTGTLTMNGENSYTGGNHLKGGITKVKKLSNQYSATGNLGGITSLATLFTIEDGATLMTTEAVEQGSPMQMVGEAGGIINNAADFTVSKVISGTKLTKKGSGWMKLNVSNPSLGTLVIAAGTVQCMNANTPAKIVEFQGGRLDENTSTGYTINIPKGKTGTWNTVNDATYTNTITGEGTLTVSCPVRKGGSSPNYWYATRTHMALKLNSFAGTLTVTSNGDPGGRFTLDTSNGMPNGTLNVPSGVVVLNTAKTFRVGKLSGSGELGGISDFGNGTSGANTWQVGNDANWSCAVKITANSNLVKLGTGKITWNAANTNTGTTTVKEGELCISATTKLGTGRLTVNEGAILSGNNNKTKALENNAFVIDGTIRPGTIEGSITGTIYFGGKNVTINEKGVLSISANKCMTNSSNGCTGISNIGSLTLNGTIRIIPTSINSLQEGDSIRLWTDVTTVSGTPKVEGTNGIEWDDSRLISEGLLFVKKIQAGIASPFILQHSTANIYDIHGRMVRRGATSTEGLKPGIYVIEGRKCMVK